MNSFRRFAIITTALTYFLIFVGGLVRVSGAGLGCPDWPRCFGRWIPPTNLEQLPPEFDPSTFNITLAWIEYVNRLVGVLVGLFILVLAYRSIRYHRHQRKIVIPAIAALILVAIQGWQGSVVVAMGLDPDVVNIHLYTALVIVGTLLYLTQQSFYLDPQLNDEISSDYHGGFGWTLWSMLILVAIQVVIGSQVRGGFEELRKTLQFVPNIAVINLMGRGLRIHMWLGIIMVILAGFEYYQIRLRGTNASRLMSAVMVMVFALLVIQTGMGLALVRIGLPPIVQLFHLWAGSILLGLTMIQLIAYRYSRSIQGGA